MKTEKDIVRFLLLIIGVVVGLATIVLCLSGCAAGRGDAGEIIVGLEVGRLVETFNHAAHFGISMLPEPWGTLAAGLLATLTGVGGGYLANKSRDKADAAFDEGVSRAGTTPVVPVEAVGPREALVDALILELTKKPRPIDPS